MRLLEVIGCRFTFESVPGAVAQRISAELAVCGFVDPASVFDALVEFQPQQHRIDGLQHLVVFPMVTQNGSSDRLVEAVLVEVIWPEFVAELEAGDYSNALFVPLRFIDFTAGYDTNSAVLFPVCFASDQDDPVAFPALSAVDLDHLMTDFR